VDMTPEMIDRARAAAEARYSNVEFRLGEIENLPVRDGEADVVISNCVINLSPDKGRVFREAFRALKPGGRLMVSDIVLSGELPEKARTNMTLWAGCISGAILEKEYLALLQEAGFAEVGVVSRRSAEDQLDPEEAAALRDQVSGLSEEETRRLGGMIQSVQVRATKATKG